MTVDCKYYMDIVLEYNKSANDAEGRYLKTLIFKSKAEENCKNDLYLAEMVKTNTAQVVKYKWNVEYFTNNNMHVVLFVNNDRERESKMRQLQIKKQQEEQHQVQLQQQQERQRQLIASLERSITELINKSKTNNIYEMAKQLVNFLTIIKTFALKSEIIPFISFELLKSFRLLLTSSNKVVRVHTCRAIRYITCNEIILDQMKTLNIPIFMMICLERVGQKYVWERLHALKWIDHLVSNYPSQIPKYCVKSLVDFAAKGENEYRRIFRFIMQTLHKKPRNHKSMQW
eukprot:77294_1